VERRRFLQSCAVTSGALALGGSAFADAPVRRYAGARLVDIHGTPIKASALAVDTNYVFQYPYASTPCFLLNLGRAVTTPAHLRKKDGTAYAWTGGVGSGRSIVAFSAICAHKLAYPTREVSFIRYQSRSSATSDAKVIHCCADHSVYDPAGGARVISGPAPQPLAAVLLEHDAGTDELRAVGTQGAEQFDEFFRKYEFKLAMEYGANVRQPVREAATVRELTQYCRQTIEC
jgi:Rieske Fe-S protein